MGKSLLESPVRVEGTICTHDKTMSSLTACIYMVVLSHKPYHDSIVSQANKPQTSLLHIFKTPISSVCYIDMFTGSVAMVTFWTTTALYLR